MKLPGRCSVCRQDVVWNGRYWRDPGRGRTVHACPEDRPTCGAWMPLAKERCARRPGHRFSHTTRYAMDNALRMAAGRRAPNQWTPTERCAPPDCVLPVGHASACRSRWFASDARRAG